MTIIDHLLFAAIAFVHPIAGYISFKKLIRRIKAGETIDRANLYKLTMLGHWVLCGVLLVAWFVSGRSAETLGFGWSPSPLFYAGLALTLVALLFLVMQTRQLASAGAAELQKFRGQFGTLEFIVPRNGAELGRFYALSLTAGIVEEILWRGFFFWYLGHFMPIWVAAIVISAGFGIAHAYQGAANVPRIILVGAVFAGIFLLTGSLWLPIVLHAAVDIVQGRLGYIVMRKTDFADSSPDNPVAVEA